MQDNILIIQFEKTPQPLFKEVKNKKWVLYGEDNLYPNYLLDLFNSSPKHGSIIKGKAKYIAGEGWTGDSKRIGVMGEPLPSMTRKCALDMEIFGGYFLEIVWSAVGKIGSVRHVDYTKYRVDKSGLFFYRKEDWKDNKEQEEVIPAFNPVNPTGKQILYYREYRPSVDIYAIPEYISTINYIEADIEVSKHVLNNAKGGFTASKIINLYNGEPDSDDEKKEIERKFKNKFTGSDGFKFILSFNKDKESGIDVQDLGQSDLVKEDFAQVDNLISQNIFVGHQITSPMLFGIRVAGQLGGSTEMQDAYKIFQNTYVTTKQQQIEEVFNTLGSFANANVGKIIPVYQEEKSLPSTPSKFSIDDEIAIYAEYGKPKSDYEIISSKPVRFSSDMEADEIAQLQFEEVNILNDEARILEVLKSNPFATPSEIANALNIPEDMVSKLMSSLIRRGVIEVTEEENGTKRIPKEQGNTGRNIEVGIKYSYEVKQGVGDAIIPTTRDFCRRLINLDRLYTRQEIETISRRLGYNVFERKGGWWRQSEDEVSPECRHEFKANVVIKKK